MALTRILNNQVTDSSAGNTYLGINAGSKVQDYSVTAGKLANNLTYASNLTVQGNLDVQGTTTTIISSPNRAPARASRAIANPGPRL